MKKSFFALFFLSVFLCYSQQKQFNIEWKGTKTLSTSSSTIEVPWFNEANFSFDDVTGLKFVTQWESNQLINESSVVITNIRYAPISRTELKDVDLKTIPNQVTSAFKNTNARSKQYAYL